MSADLFRPPHAYVPGRTPRHPEGLFDPIRQTARPGLSEAELADSAALAAGLTYLDEGFFWEAHEVLEPVWMACPPNSAARLAVQALIQIANARLKLRMERPGAAARILSLAEGRLTEAQRAGRAVVLGLTLDSIGARLEAVKRKSGGAL